MKKYLALTVFILGFVFINNFTHACVDLNNASFNELQSITHVGIDEAIAILKLRNALDLRSTDDLRHINSISATELAEIKAEGLACVIGLTSSELASGVCVDLNHASFNELQNITNVGIDEAIAILKLRSAVDFRSTDDLKHINSINAAELAEIKAEGLACV